MESLTGFSQAPPPLQTTFPHILPQNLFFLLPTQYFFIRTLKKFEKQIHNLPSWETIPDCNTYSDLLSIRPLMYILTVKPKIL